MKKIFYLSVLVTTLTLTSCEGNESPAPTKNEYIEFSSTGFREICCLRWDANGDGKLSYQEASLVKSIGTTFYGCEYLEDTFHEFQYFTGISSIPDNAFYGCTQLQGITLPPQITHIGKKAFAECHRLGGLNIPSNVKSIGANAFSNAGSKRNYDKTSLKIESFSDWLQIDFAGKEANPLSVFRCTALNTVNSILREWHFPQDITKLKAYVFCGYKDLIRIEVPDHITQIDAAAFADSGLIEINIPEGVTYIASNVFINSNLSKVTIPNSVISIGECAFSGCKLSSIKFPNSVTKIETCAFSGCQSLRTIEISEYITYIGNGAFSSCRQLETVYCRSTTPPEVGWAIFNDISLASDFKIYVPTTSVEAYKNASGWRDYAWRIVGYDFE